MFWRLNLNFLGSNGCCSTPKHTSVDKALGWKNTIYSVPHHREKKRKCYARSPIPPYSYSFTERGVTKLKTKAGSLLWIFFSNSNPRIEFDCFPEGFFHGNGPNMPFSRTGESSTGESTRYQDYQFLTSVGGGERCLPQAQTQPVGVPDEMTRSGKGSDSFKDRAACTIQFVNAVVRWGTIATKWHR